MIAYLRPKDFLLKQETLPKAPKSSGRGCRSLGYRGLGFGGLGFGGSGFRGLVLGGLRFVGLGFRDSGVRLEGKHISQEPQACSRKPWV